MRPPVRTARKLNHPDRLQATWREVVLGDDRYGHWAVLPAGEPVHRESGTILRYASDQIHCYPHDQGWVARFGTPDARFEAVRADGTTVRFDHAEPDRVDISTTPVTVDGVVSFVDLVLDVVRRDDGTVEVLDEHEVDELTARYAIPAARMAEARRSCARVARMLAGCEPPFDGTADRWHALFQVREQGGTARSG